MFELLGDRKITQKVRVKPIRRANDLDGTEWQRNSISVWNDIKKDPVELRLSQHHPAIFPTMLATRIIRSFTTVQESTVLDPFLGSGSTIVAAVKAGKTGVGFDIYRKYIKLTEDRLKQVEAFAQVNGTGNYKLYEDDARNMLEHLKKESVDLVITSPPYWDILSQKRTADNKQSRDYGKHKKDLGTIHSYFEFIDALGEIFEKVLQVLKRGKYCVVNVMDLRKKDKFFPLHSDLAKKMEEIGFVWDDLIIWDRRSEYNNLRPLGYPSVFRINKVHEYLLIFQKPINKL